MIVVRQTFHTCGCGGMADAQDSKSCGGDLVWVQVPPSARKELWYAPRFFFMFMNKELRIPCAGKSSSFSFEYLFGNTCTTAATDEMIRIIQISNDRGTFFAGSNKRYTGINFWKGSDFVKMSFIHQLDRFFGSQRIDWFSVCFHLIPCGQNEKRRGNETPEILDACPIFSGL